MQIGQRPLEAGTPYFWRVAAEHPVFGSSGFSPVVRLVLAEAPDDDGGAPRLVVHTVGYPSPSSRTVPSPRLHSPPSLYTSPSPPSTLPPILPSIPGD